MKRAYYSNAISSFLDESSDQIFGIIAQSSAFAIEASQRDAWLEQISILKTVLIPYRQQGSIYFEYSIPRLGKRIDVVAVIGHVIFVI